MIMKLVRFVVYVLILHPSDATSEDRERKTLYI